MWAHEEVVLVKQQVKQNRKEVDGFHQHIYNTAVALASEVRLSEETPRVTGWQQHRTNPEASTPCEFYHHSTAWPLLDHLQVQLEEQFSAGLQSARHLHHFDYLALWSSKEGWATEEGWHRRYSQCMKQTCHMPMQPVLSCKRGTSNGMAIPTTQKLIQPPRCYRIQTRSCILTSPHFLGLQQQCQWQVLWVKGLSAPYICWNHI